MGWQSLWCFDLVSLGLIPESHEYLMTVLLIVQRNREGLNTAYFDVMRLTRAADVQDAAPLIRLALGGRGTAKADP
jgi:hypothetical protein